MHIIQFVMNTRLKNTNLRLSRLLILLLLASVVPVAFTGCNNGDPEISITVKSDYGKIIEALNSTNKSLTEKLQLIETAMARGFADNQEAQALLQQAVSSLSGTLAEKLAAIEAAVKNQTTSLETKLGLIEAAVASGFADSKAQQATSCSRKRSTSCSNSNRSIRSPKIWRPS